MIKSRQTGRQRRHERIRKKVSGTPDRPRLSVYRSLNHIYVQIIDDTSGKTLTSASSINKEIEGKQKHRGNCATAKDVGTLVARLAQGQNIKKVVFDRSGYLYHGRIKALAEAAREAGLEF